MLVVRVFAFLALAVCGLWAVADECHQELVFCDEGGYPCYYEWVCYPEYYVTQTTQPNWCLYQHGDEVDIEWAIVGGQFVAVSWYVTPVNDPGRDGDYYVYKVGNQCQLQQYPW